MNNIIKNQEQFNQVINEVICESLDMTMDELLDNCNPYIDDLSIQLGDEFNYTIDALPLNDAQAMVSFSYVDNQFIICASFNLCANATEFAKNLEAFESTNDAKYLECNTEPFENEDDEEGFLELVSALETSELTEEEVKLKVKHTIAIYYNGEGFNKYIAPFIV